MPEFTYQLYGKKDSPAKLVVYLHGYNQNQKNGEAVLTEFAGLLPDSVIAAPLAETVSEKNSETRQWYSIDVFDPQGKRRNPQCSTAEIMEIYDTAAEQLAEQALKINHFITKLQQQFKIDDGHTYLSGFSQGAQLALYTALTRKSVLGGCIMFSGIVAGKNRLEKELSAHPQILLMHGDADNSILSKTHEASRHWLLSHGLHLKSVYIPGLDHRIISSELQEAAKMINMIA